MPDAPEKSLAAAIRDVANAWAEGARLAEKHGQMFTSPPVTMRERVAELLALAERAEGEGKGAHLRRRPEPRRVRPRSPLGPHRDENPPPILALRPSRSLHLQLHIVNQGRH
jgi:hypothetical protein